MATIYIDNKPYEVKDGQNLLSACLSLGFDIPYFCWHPALHSVGACRQCAVKQFKDEKDTAGKIVMSCMTPASNGTRISIDDPDVKLFRASVIEWLMMNHPHDCPICDEGGECHLQDMTVMTGHVYRNFRFRKKTYKNQYLGPFVNHEMNRCIQCYRCVRFYRDYAGGRDLDVFASHDHVYFGRHEDGVLNSEFSGNLVEICPTGVFTDKTLKKHYTRKWDLQTAPSICVHCGLGCNIIAGERYGKLRRILNRYNGEVNSYFLCDRGRFGYEFVNSEQRIRNPLIRTGGSAVAVSREEVLQQLSHLLYFGAKVIGIGSPRASLESNFALRAFVGHENFYSGASEKDFRLISLIIDILHTGPARSPSLRDIASADAVFVIGEDTTNVAPLLALALRQSVRRKPMEIAKRLNIPEWNDKAVRNALQDEKGPLFLASCYATRSEDAATFTYHAAPDDLARLGFAVAGFLDNGSPMPTDMTEELKSLSQKIAQSLKEAKKPLIISGITSGSEAIIQAATNVASALYKNNPETLLSFIMPECNSIGSGLIGGKSINDAFEAIQSKEAETVIILENDLYRRADAESVDNFLDRCKNIIVIDHIYTQTASKAEVVIPAATFAESGGTLVNNEGRGQRFFKAFEPENDIQESWRWLLDMMAIAERPEAKKWNSLDDIISAIAEDVPVFKPILEIAPTAEFRIKGKKIPRQPHRYSGRTAMTANISVHEPKPGDDHDSPLSFSMEGYEGQPPSPLISRFWAPGWNSVQSVNKFQSEIEGSLRGGDPGKRLIEPAKIADKGYFKGIPSVFVPREVVATRSREEWLVVPLYHIFGSEELSVLSSGIAELSPKPYIALNEKDTNKIGVNESDEVKLSFVNNLIHLPVKLVPSLPDGVAGISAGIPGMKWIDLPGWGKIARMIEKEGK